MAASVRAVGTVASGATTCSPGLPAGHTTGDALYIVVESVNSSSAAGTPAVSSGGYSKLSEGTSAGGAAGVTTLTIFGKIDGGSESAPTVDGYDDHGIARMWAVKDHGLSLITDTVVGTQTNAAATTSITSSAITVAAGSLVFLCVSTSRDATSTTDFTDATAADANLTNIAEIIDNGTATASGGGVGVWSGDCAGTNSGTFTVTQSNSSTYNSVQLGVPAAAVSATKSLALLGVG